jgi:hypothetical protein
MALTIYCETPTHGDNLILLELIKVFHSLMYQIALSAKGVATRLLQPMPKTISHSRSRPVGHKEEQSRDHDKTNTSPFLSRSD